ncbi:hypothetical protein SAMN02745857_02746 [Andreprevotia lacus DSM 23236]|jgi:hypothetical protein|uniref:Uncharacterized protein n=1 Tax=Andreprevotia lacus DSM 23236 TaxID=1121001 RepID=A0A1W1XUH8_9NEIS|nr:hypothetical protein [Andreprevotia lacus]SMC27191.1 hypothetical protein SAMN02745857_02746 [Andreprevotia lacus DSM 23236]
MAGLIDGVLGALAGGAGWNVQQAQNQQKLDDWKTQQDYVAAKQAAQAEMEHNWRVDDATTANERQKEMQQIGFGYEQKTHDRDRAERVSDIDNERQYSDKVRAEDFSNRLKLQGISDGAAKSRMQAQWAHDASDPVRQIASKLAEAQYILMSESPGTAGYNPDRYTNAARVLSQYRTINPSTRDYTLSNAQADAVHAITAEKDPAKRQAMAAEYRNIFDAVRPSQDSTGGMSRP